MDIYDLKMMGHSGFENCRIKDVYSYDQPCVKDGELYQGDLDDAPDCLDYLEITSIDVYLNEKTKQLEITLDVEGADDDVYNELFGDGELEEEPDEEQIPYEEGEGKN